MKLVPRLTLWFMVCMAVLLSGRGLLRVQHQSKAFDADMKLDHCFIGRSLAAGVSELSRLQGDQIAQHLVQVASNTAGRGIELSWVGAGSPATVALTEADQARLRRGNEVQRFENHRLVSLFPVRGSSAIAALVVSESLAERDRYVRSSEIHASVSLVFVMLCCGALATVLSRWLVATPVRLLIDKARRVASGDFSTPLELARNDEFQSLAAEMNAMCDALARAKAEVLGEARARQLAVEQLRHADRLSTVGKLAAGVAHELGTPLSIVSGHAEMIANREVQGEKIIESASIIDREAKRIARIVRSLLGFARRKGPEGDSSDAAETAAQCAALLEPLAEKANVQIQVESRGNCRATIDQDSLQQVMTNLLSNAIQALRAGGTVRLNVTTTQITPPKERGTGPRDFVRVTISDDGPGITPEVLAHIFEPFFSTKPPGEGTGLGLSVVYGIVEDHRGFIEVESSLGKGTDFSVFLPQTGPL